MLEKLVMFPFELFKTLVKMFIPILICLLGLAIAISYPYLILALLTGFLLSPRILKLLNIIPYSSNTGLEEMIHCRNELNIQRSTKNAEINLLKESYGYKEKQLLEKLDNIKNNTLTLDDWYNSILLKKPDKIIVIETASLTLLDRIKHKLSLGV